MTKCAFCFNGILYDTLISSFSILPRSVFEFAFSYEMIHFPGSRAVARKLHVCSVAVPLHNNFSFLLYSHWLILYIFILFT